MKAQTKNTIRLILLGFAAVAMFLLVIGLPQIELSPGLPFERIWQFLLDQFAAGRNTGMTASELPGGDLIMKIYRTIFFIALVVFPFAVILVLIDPVLRKRVISTTIVLLILVFLLSLVMRNQTEGEDPVREAEIGAPQAPLAGLPVEPLDVEDFQAGQISPWIGRGLSLALGLLAAFILLVIINQIRKNREAAPAGLDDLALHARTALTELEGGGDLQNTILRCYAEMSRIVREARGLRRNRTVTAREFTDALVRANLPRRPVETLTRLFEKARYGSGATTPQDEQDAISSLRTIVRACDLLGGDFGGGPA
ncbi:MAG: DUF4129 domain-containing protein [Anaerolineae bacterium]|nr:DUF4129 domain-containing protein [Anaerolineae bacterium]